MFKDIEEMVTRIVKEKQDFRRVMLTKSEALELFQVNFY